MKQECSYAAPLVVAGVPDSPALAVGRDEAAFELKFRLSGAQAAEVEAWARGHLPPDNHGADGVYRVTSLYCDTPRLDVFHRSPGFRRSKHRVRRYGALEWVFVERKRKAGDRVRKRRDRVGLDWTGCLGGGGAAPPAEGQPGDWFAAQVRKRELRPVCLVGYERAAFVGQTPEGPVRMTLDRGVAGEPAGGWQVPAGLSAGRALLGDDVVLEMKFCVSLPGLFKRLLEALPAGPGRASKYRLCVEAWGLAGAGG